MISFHRKFCSGIGLPDHRICGLCMDVVAQALSPGTAWLTVAPSIVWLNPDTERVSEVPTGTLVVAVHGLEIQIEVYAQAQIGQRETIVRALHLLGNALQSYAPAVVDDTDQ